MHRQAAVIVVCNLEGSRQALKLQGCKDEERWILDILSAEFSINNHENEGPKGAELGRAWCIFGR